MRIVDRLMLIIMSILVFAMAGIVVAYGYFQVTETQGIDVSTGEFDIELVVKFDGQIVTTDSPYYDKDLKKIIVNAFDDTADNYIGDLTIDLVVRPEVAARMRFKVQQEWELQRYYKDQDPLNPIDPIFETVYHSEKTSDYYPYSLLKWASGMSVKSEQDGMIYYTEVIPSSETITIPIIDGGDSYTVRSNTVLYEECYVYIDLFIDLVQANRFAEVWEIDSTYFDN